MVVATAQRGDLPLELSYTASTRGSREVEVRSRVSGILLARRYQEGSFVKEGAPLFKIDPATFQAAVDTAAGALEMEKARFVQAEREKERIGPLYEKKGVSQRERDDSVSNYEIAKASAAAAEARLRTGQARPLLYRRAGADLRLHQQGDPLGRQPGAGRLGVEPAHHHRPPRPALRRVFDARRRGAPAPPGARHRARRAGDAFCSATAARWSIRSRPRSTSSTAAVEGSSSTVKARASLPNPDASLLPGQFLRVRLDGLLAQKRGDRAEPRPGAGPDRALRVGGGADGVPDR